MKLTLGRAVFGAVLGAFIATAPLGATSIGSGQFNLSGNLYINSTSIDFGYTTVPPPGDQTAGIQLPDTGPFTGLTPGMTAGIKNLTSTPAYPSGAISVTSWITLPDGISLDLTSAPFNMSVGTCNGTSDSNECRPVVGGTQSPIILSQSATGVTAILGVAGNAYLGTSASGTTPFNGTLSANFTGYTIDSLLAVFQSQGFINTSYSGNFSTTAVPEPGMLAGLGLCMLLAGSVRRKFRSAKAE
jgi:hypothetical protein